MSLGTKLGILSELDAAVAGGGGSAGSYYVELQVDDTNTTTGDPGGGGNQNSQGDESSYYAFDHPYGNSNDASYTFLRVDSGSADTSVWRQYPGGTNTGGVYTYTGRFLIMDGSNYGPFDSADGTTAISGLTDGAHFGNGFEAQIGETSLTTWGHYYTSWLLSPATETTWTRAEILDPDFQMGYLVGRYTSSMLPGSYTDTWYMDIRAADTSPNNSFEDEWGTYSNVGRQRLGEIPENAAIQSVSIVTQSKKRTGGYKGKHKGAAFAQMYGLVLFTIP